MASKKDVLAKEAAAAKSVLKKVTPKNAVSLPSKPGEVMRQHLAKRAVGINPNTIPTGQSGFSNVLKDAARTASGSRTTGGVRKVAAQYLGSNPLAVRAGVSSVVGVAARLNAVSTAASVGYAAGTALSRAKVPGKKLPGTSQPLTVRDSVSLGIEAVANKLKKPKAKK